MSFELLKKALPEKLNVVGNANSLLSQSYGKEIDELPTIRFNQIDIVNPDSQGTRWDFLASSEVKTFEKYNKQIPAFHTLLFTPYLDIHKSHLNYISFDTIIYEISLDFSKGLTQALGFKPSTGFQILTMLSELKRHVNIFGFDWKKTPTIYDKNREWDPHNYEMEKYLTQNLLKINKKLWKIY